MQDAGGSEIIGQAVRIRGLVEWPDLNGLEGNIDGWDEIRGCWKVRMRDGSTKIFKPDNLEHSGNEPAGTLSGPFAGLSAALAARDPNNLPGQTPLEGAPGSWVRGLHQASSSSGPPSPQRRRVWTPGSQRREVAEQAGNRDLPMAPLLPSGAAASAEGTTGLSQDLEQMHVGTTLAPPSPATRPAADRFYCPVPGCREADRSRRPRWTTFVGLRPHIDAHILGILPDRPPQEWMDAGNWTACRWCSKLVSKRCLGGIHRTCHAEEQLRDVQRRDVAMDPESSGYDSTDLCADLPSLDDIFAKDVFTQEFLGEGLVGLAGREFTACVARVLQYNRADAWDHEVDGQDTPERGRARRAWLEMFMFHKTCLPALPGGKAKANRNKNILATKLQRWASGERGELWGELPDRPRKRQPGRDAGDSEQAEKLRQSIAMSLGRRGQPAKAISRLIDPGLAPDTTQVENIMRSKFIAPPASQAGSSRPPAPVANEVSEECVVRSIKSFNTGAAPGLSGHRPDFMKQIIGQKGDASCVSVFTAFVNMLANGEAPRALAPYLGGAVGTAQDKVSKTGEQDARPTCAGECWRRLVSKCMLSTELDNLREHLLPHQLAVGVPGGVEVMPHLARAWMGYHSNDPDRILLAYDEGNAHNEVDRHTFLNRMSEIAPGICRWLEFIYPTDQATIVLYRGCRIDSRAGGQQGCPLMMACHAVVQRIVLEGLGIAEVDPRTTAVAPVLDPPADLDMTPMFADDGFLAGKSAEVLRALRHLQPVMPLLGLRFSMLEAVTAAAGRHTVARAAFENLGCTWNETGNLEVLKSPIGSPAWSTDYSKRRAVRGLRAVAALGALPGAHVAYYLARASAGACQLTYLSRTTPAEVCADALGDFDVAMHAAFGRVTGLSISRRQWTQATAPVRHAGLGLRQASWMADAAYAASVRAAEARAVEIWPEYALHTNFALDRALDRLNGYIGAAVGDATARAGYSQRQWTQLLDNKRDSVAKEMAAPDDRARLHAYSASTSCKWFTAIPSQAIDTELTNAAFRDHVAMQLGVDVCDTIVPCGFCGMLCDTKGRHACSCMAGGDHDLLHNEIRDEVHQWCRRAALRPKLEQSGLLRNISLPDARRRPADVLVCQTTSFLQGLPGGAPPDDVTKVALDFAVVNALGQSHHAETFSAPLRAAIAYSERKCTHERTKTRCAEAGIAFEPVVFEIQGGVEPRAAAIIHRIAEMVAAAENLDPAVCKRNMLQSLALIITRWSSKMVRRRVAKVQNTREGLRLKRVLAEMSLPQMEDVEEMP